MRVVWSAINKCFVTASFPQQQLFLSTFGQSQGCPFQNIESGGTGFYFEPVPFLGFNLIVKKTCA